MADRRKLLEYADPPETVEQRLARWSRAALWFVFKRRVRAGEVVLAGVSAAALLHVLAFTIFLRPFGSGPTLFGLIDGASSATFFAALLTVCYLPFNRRWDQALRYLLLLVLVAAVSGIIRVERCPHAIYVQVYAVSIPVWGKGCGNYRNFSPWWKS